MKARGNSISTKCSRSRSRSPATPPELNILTIAWEVTFEQAYPVVRQESCAALPGSGYRISACVTCCVQSAPGAHRTSGKYPKPEGHYSTRTLETNASGKEGLSKNQGSRPMAMTAERLIASPPSRHCGVERHWHTHRWDFRSPHLGGVLQGGTAAVPGSESDPKIPALDQVPQPPPLHQFVWCCATRPLRRTIPSDADAAPRIDALAARPLPIWPARRAWNSDRPELIGDDWHTAIAVVTLCVQTFHRWNCHRRPCAA